jgi:hypothetical protein
MSRFSLLFIFIFTFFIRSGLYGIGFNDSVSGRIDIIEQDSLKERQILYNGRVWRNLYYRVRGDQFLFSQDFLQGSVTINGNSFKNILINYDIYNDEILTPKNNGSIIQLNKEMVDSFTLVFGGKTYRFVNAQEDSLPVIKGYVKVLYKGKSALYVKYKKEIEALAVEEKYDLFYRTYRIYFLKEGTVHQISNKSDLLKDLQEEKTRIKDFMKKNRLKVSKKEPDSFIPVIRYYDSISR